MKRYVTHLAVVAIALAIVLAPFAAAQNSNRPAQQVGGEVISNPASSTDLTVASGSQWCILTVRTAGIHVSLDGTAATTSDLYLPAGSVVSFDGPALLANMAVINSSDGSAVVYVAYMSQR